MRAGGPCGCTPGRAHHSLATAHRFPEGTTSRWSEIAALLPSKGPHDVRKRYQKLLSDIYLLEDGERVLLRYRKANAATPLPVVPLPAPVLTSPLGSSDGAPLPSPMNEADAVEVVNALISPADDGGNVFSFDE